VVRCVERRGPDGVPRDVIDYRGAVAIFAFKGEEEHYGRLVLVQVVLLVFGENKALLYRQEVVKGLGWDVLAYGKCYEDTVDSILEMLKFYMSKAREGMYELVGKRIKPGYENLFT